MGSNPTPSVEFQSVAQASAELTAQAREVAGSNPATLIYAANADGTTS